jgi:hypothetical protein
MSSARRTRIPAKAMYAVTLVVVMAFSIFAPRPMCEEDEW